MSASTRTKYTGLATSNVKGLLKDRDKPYKCQVCDKGYISRYGRDNHRRKKHPEYVKPQPPKQYACTYDGCNKSFDSKSGRWNHIRSIHKGLRHECEYPNCNKSFVQWIGLNRHKKTVHLSLEYSISAIYIA